MGNGNSIWIVLGAFGACFIETCELLLHAHIKLNARKLLLLNPLHPFLRLTNYGLVGGWGHRSTYKDLDACYRILYRPSWYIQKTDEWTRYFRRGNPRIERRLDRDERENRIGIEYWEVRNNTFSGPGVLDGLAGSPAGDGETLSNHEGDTAEPETPNGPVEDSI